MNHKTVLTRYIYFTIILFLVINIYIPSYYGSEYPKTLGPQFTPRINDEHLGKINKSKPELILIGDSTLGLGVNQSLLTEQSNMETYSLAIPGSATAAWYLVMKNIIAKAKQPKYVVVLFRDTMLTIPYFRTTGRYLELLDDYASKNEPLLTELAFINQMSPVEKFAEQYIPLYGLRWEIRKTLDNQLRYVFPSALAGCERECADDAVKSIFGREINVSALSQAIDDAGASLYTPDEMDFDSHIGESFLPPMLELAKKTNTTLIFVRLKTLRYHDLNDQPTELRNYISSLDTYLSSYSNVYYVDFAADERIIDSYFADAIHLNETGRDAFTLILADELRNILK